MEPSNDPIRDYIRANRDRYTREAIREQLIAAGHRAEDIDRAWEELATAEPPPSRFNGLAVFALVLLVVGAAFAAFGALLVTSFNYVIARGPAGFFVLYAVLYLGIGSVIIWVASQIRVSGTAQFVLGILLVPVYISLMLGTCLAAANLTS